MKHLKTFENFKFNEAIDEVELEDLYLEFNFYNLLLSEGLKVAKYNENWFRKNVNNGKVKSLNTDEISKLYMRYNENFKTLDTLNVTADEKLNWWYYNDFNPSKHFEEDKQNKEYFDKLVTAVNSGSITDPIIILNIPDENNNVYKFVSGGRNRLVISYILKKNVNVLEIDLNPETSLQINKLIQNLNK